MNKRLEMLKQMVASDHGDAFAYYGLAMEYRRLGQHDDALKTFGALREKYSDYLPMYLMAAQVLLEQGQKSEARPWIEQGIALAEQTGDSKTLGELEAALEETQD